MDSRIGAFISVTAMTAFALLQPHGVAAGMDFDSGQADRIALFEFPSDGARDFRSEGGLVGRRVQVSAAALKALHRDGGASLAISTGKDTTAVWSFTGSASYGARMPVQVLLDGADAVPFLMDGPTTWIGTDGSEGSSGYLTLVGDQVYGRLEGEAGAFSLMPDPKAAGWSYLTELDGAPSYVRCAVPPPPEPVHLDLSDPEVAAALKGEAPQPPNGFDSFPVRYRLTVAFDVSASLLVPFNGDMAAATAYLLAITEGVNTIYERDLYAQLQVTAIRFRTEDSDPYVGYTTHDDILERFSSVLKAERLAGTLPPLMAEANILHLIYRGSDGGVAWGANVCGEFPEWRIGVTSLPGTPNVFPLLDITGEVDTLAHEFGHQVGAPHTHCYDPPVHRCFSGECYQGPRAVEDGDIMSYCPVQHLHFHPVSRLTITRFLESQSCLRAFDTDRFDPDEAVVPPITPQRIQWRVLSPTDPVDRARFTLAKPSLVRVSARFSLPTAASLRVLDSDGATVATGVWSPPNDTVLLERSYDDPLPSGDYTIIVEADPAPDGAVAYGLRFTHAACDESDHDILEPDNGPEEARPLAPGAVEYHTLTVDDEDWFVLDVSTEASDRRISITALGGSLHAYLINDNQKPVRRIEWGQEEDFHFPCHDWQLPAGRYYLRVLNRSGSPVRYQVAYSERPCECEAAVASALIEAPIAGSSFSVDVDVQGECFWNAWTSDRWIENVAVNKVSNQATFSVAANTGLAREGGVMVAGQRVVVRQPGGDPFEPNDTIANATQIQTGTMVGHALWPNNDADIFKFTLNAPARAVVTSSIPLGRAEIAHVDSVPLDFGHALSLGGDGAHVVVPPGVWFSGNYTVECWVNPSKISAWGRVFDFSNGAGADNVILMTSRWHSGRPAFHVIRDFQEQIWLEAAGPLPLDAWTHLAITFDGSHYRLFRNGELESELQSSEAAAPVVRNQCYLGRSPWEVDERFAGQLDQFRFWSRALTTEEIRASMNDPGATSGNGLLASYRLDSLEDLGAGSNAGINDLGDDAGGLHAELAGAATFPAHKGVRVLAKSTRIAAGECFGPIGGPNPTSCRGSADALDLGCLDPGTYYISLQQLGNPAPSWQGESRTIVHAFPCGAGSVVAYPPSETIERTDVKTFFHVLAPSDLPWTASTSAPWLTLSPASGTGPGILVVVAQANWWSSPTNTGTQRTGTINVGGATITITQLDDTCARSSTVSPTALTLPASGGAGSAYWKLQQESCRDGSPPLYSPADWLEVESNAAYRDAIRVFARPNPTALQRTADVVDQEGNKLLTVMQAGEFCAAPVDTVTISAPNTGGDFDVTGLLQGLCAWQERSLVPWASLPPQDRYFGTTPINLRVEANSTRPRRTTNIFGGALSFDGIDDYVSIPAGTWFSGPFTIEARVYPHSWVQWRRIMDFGNGSGADTVVLAGIGGVGNQGYPILTVLDGTGALIWEVRGSRRIPFNRWSHVAATFDGSTARLYLDSELVGERTGIDSPPATVTRSLCYLGRDTWNANEYFDGMLDDFRIWSRALAADEVQINVGKAELGNRDGLVLHLKMNEASGTTLLDAAGTRNSTVHGALRTTAQRGMISVGEREIIVEQAGDGDGAAWMLY